MFRYRDDTPSPEEDPLSRSLLGGEPTEQTPTISTSFDLFNLEHLWESPRTQEEPEQQTPETTNTQDSFQTVPELSEPTEQLFRDLLATKKEQETTKPEPKTEINTMMAETSKMNVDTDKGSKTSELKLKTPMIFSGKQEELDEFLDSVELYLDINDEIYNTDKKKIGFALSFMDEGDAKSWKSQFQHSKKTNGNLNLGTWSDFEKEIKKAFQPYDAPGDALDLLTTLRMNSNTSIEDHIGRFKRLLRKSEVPETSPSAIDYFRRTLTYPLQIVKRGPIRSGFFPLSW